MDTSVINMGSFVSAKLSCDRNWNNYKAWKEQMMCFVESQGLVGFIDGNSKQQNDDVAAWRQTDSLLKGWIMGALSDEVLHNVVNLDSARDVWLELENMFSQSEIEAPPQPLPPPPVAVAYQEKRWHEYLPLYRAAASGDWDTAKTIFEQDPDAIRARVAYTFETALHVAVGMGNSTNFVSKLVPLMSDEDLAKTNSSGQNALHCAALMGNLDAAKILVNRLPDLLYVPTAVKHFPVHLAADCGHRETLEFLISQTKHDMPTDPFDGVTGLRLLLYMIDAGFFDMALNLVARCPHLARIVPPTRVTALAKMALQHSAISVDAQLNWWERLVYPYIKVEMETQSFDIENQPEPPREYKVVSTLCKVFEHLVPCIKRVHQKKLKREQALSLVKCLCKHLESLKHEEASPIYRNAILTAATSGIQEIIEIIVGTFPHAIYARDAMRQYFLHMAVKNRCEKVFNLVYQTSNHRYNYINSVDSSDNTILHLAAKLAPPHKLNLVSGAALQMQREMQWFKEVHQFICPYYKKLTNNDGKTAEMIFTEEHKELKIEGEKWMKDTANSCTIAAALIATVVFAAAITVPGGNESSSGYPIFSQASAAFTIFAVSDAVSLFTSTTSLLMFLSILTSRYAEQDFLYALPKRLCIGLFTLFLSILFMVAAFASTVYLVFWRRNAWVLMAVGALACLPISSFVLLQFPLLFDVVSSTYGRGIFGKQSDRPFP